MAQTPQPSYEDARMRAREAFQRCLGGELVQVQEQLQHARTELKRLDGDLPIARYSQGQAIASDAPFVTHSIEQARACGWLDSIRRLPARAAASRGRPGPLQTRMAH